MLSIDWGNPEIYPSLGAGAGEGVAQFGRDFAASSYFDLQLFNHAFYSGVEAVAEIGSIPTDIMISKGLDPMAFGPAGPELKFVGKTSMILRALGRAGRLQAETTLFRTQAVLESRYLPNALEAGSVVNPLSRKIGASLPKSGKEISIWQVGNHGDMPTPRPVGTQSHHGVNSVWMEANFGKYNPQQAPAILMFNEPFHNATRGVFNRIRMQLAERQNVSPRDVDWTSIQPGTAWRLAEEQLEAAAVPLNIRALYFERFNQYLEKIMNDGL